MKKRKIGQRADDQSRRAERERIMKKTAVVAHVIKMATAKDGKQNKSEKCHQH
jgi:hypothetical protein